MMQAGWVMAVVVTCLLPQLHLTSSTDGVYHLVSEHKSTDIHLHSTVEDITQEDYPQFNDATSQEGVFPYRFEDITMAAQKRPKVTLGTPYTIKKKQSGASNRFGLKDFANTAENLNLPSLENLIPHVRPQKKRPVGSSLWLSQPLTKTELDFVGILAAIAVKLVLSTALSTWFLAAGQALYSIAALTGTTEIFGMDSAIKFIYKTVPFVEALLRGEDMFT